MKIRVGRFFFGLALIIMLFAGSIYAAKLASDGGYGLVIALILSIICLGLSSLAD